MMLWISASAITLAALQSSINAPTDAFRGYLRESSAQATGEKVSGEAIDAYLRDRCAAQMQSLRGALVAFRMKNGMAKKAAAEDAAMTVDDYVATPVENFKYRAGLNPASVTAPK